MKKIFALLVGVAMVFLTASPAFACKTTEQESPYLVVTWKMPSWENDTTPQWPQTLVTGAVVPVTSVDGALNWAFIPGECGSYQVDVYNNNQKTRDLLAGGVLNGSHDPYESLVPGGWGTAYKLVHNTDCPVDLPGHGNVSIKPGDCNNPATVVTVNNTGKSDLQYKIYRNKKFVFGHVATAKSSTHRNFATTKGSRDSFRVVLLDGKVVVDRTHAVTNRANCVTPAVYDPYVKIHGPCGDPMYRFVFDNSASNKAVTYRVHFIKYTGESKTFNRVIGAGKTAVSRYHHVLGSTVITVKARVGSKVRTIMRYDVAPSGTYHTCQA